MNVGMMPAALPGSMVGIIRLSMTCEDASEKEHFEVAERLTGVASASRRLMLGVLY
jgi:hypothetical protein